MKKILSMVAVAGIPLAFVVAFGLAYFAAQNANSLAFPPPMFVVRIVFYGLFALVAFWEFRVLADVMERREMMIAQAISVVAGIVMLCLWMCHDLGVIGTGISYGQEYYGAFFAMSAILIVYSGVITKKERTRGR